jgi:hypothetical protein
MTERLVDIPITTETRTKIKEMKRELTYEEFILKLIKNTGNTASRKSHGAAGTCSPMRKAGEKT